MTIYELYDKVIAGEEIEPYLADVVTFSDDEMATLANSLRVNLKKLADFKTGLIAGMNI